MALIPDILASHRAPRAVLRRRLIGADEVHALVTLILGCLMVWVAQWPIAARAAHLDPSIPLGGRLTGAGVAWMFLAPVLLYALAALSHVIARAFGGEGSYFSARLALFWALLAAAPLFLLNGLVAGFIGVQGNIGAQIVGLVAFVGFLRLWLMGLIEAESQPHE